MERYVFATPRLVVRANHIGSQHVEGFRPCNQGEMVLDYYKLAEQPFGVTPDPRYLYLGPTHREALASVLYSVSAGRGFTALIAEPGMGKTTLLFDFLNKVRKLAKTVFLFQAYRSPQDFELPGRLNSVAVQARVAELQRQFDYVLIDIAPLSACLDRLAVGQLAKGFILYMQANSTRRKASRKIADNLRAAKIKVWARLLINAIFPVPESLYDVV